MQQRRRIATRGQASVNPTLAVLLSIALILSAAVGADRVLRTQENGVAPIDASLATASLASGDNVVVDDPAIAAQSGVEGPRTVKEFTRDEEFSMFALTWLDNRDIAAFVRAQQADGTWGPWWDADPVGQAGPNGETGTELVYVEPTHRVQVSITGVDILGDQPSPEAPAAEAPAVDLTTPEAGTGLAPLPTNYGDIQPVADIASPDEIDVVFIDGKATEGGIALASESVTDGMPKVVTRSGWGANEGLRCRNTTYDSHTQAAAVHHTAGSNNYSQSQAAGIVRGIYSYHAKTLGWCDMGYNALVDKYGTIYEGRYGGLDKSVQGAHVGGFNHNTWGISMMGNYDVVATTPEMIQSVGEMIGWRAAVAGFHPKGAAAYTPYSFSGSKWTGGTSMTLKNVFAHRDAHNTACPGSFGYAQMDTIRSIAEQKYNEIRSGTTVTPTTTPEAEESETTTDTTVPPTTTPPAGDGGTTGTTGTTDTMMSAAGGDTNALLAIVGSLAALAVTVIASDGTVPGTTQKIGDVQILEGLKLGDLKPILDVTTTLAGDTNITRALNRVTGDYGAVLGEARGGLSTENATYALFDEGIILDKAGSSEGRALWGIIGDIWAGQGFDLGPLGLPLNEEYSSGDLIRVDFEGGYITFNPSSGDVDVKLT